MNMAGATASSTREALHARRAGVASTQWAQSVLLPPGAVDAEWVRAYARLRRRRWARCEYEASDGSLFLVLSERWEEQARFYIACHLRATGNPLRPLRSLPLGPEWTTRRKAHRFAQLLAAGHSLPVAQWLVQQGLRDTEANRTWAVLATWPK
jgi:hypothetical protein